MPKLDLRNLKHVKEYRDWYAYAGKLEDSVKFLRQRVKQLEEELNEVSTLLLEEK